MYSNVYQQQTSSCPYRPHQQFFFCFSIHTSLCKSIFMCIYAKICIYIMQWNWFNVIPFAATAAAATLVDDFYLENLFLLLSLSDWSAWSFHLIRSLKHVIIFVSFHIINMYLHNLIVPFLNKYSLSARFDVLQFDPSQPWTGTTLNC